MLLVDHAPDGRVGQLVLVERQDEFQRLLGGHHWLRGCEALSGPCGLCQRYCCRSRHLGSEGERPVRLSVGQDAADGDSVQGCAPSVGVDI